MRATLLLVAAAVSAGPDAVHAKLGGGWANSRRLSCAHDDRMRCATINASVPTEYFSPDYNESCDFAPENIAGERPKFHLRNKQELDEEGINVNRSFTWPGLMMFIVSAGTLFVSYWLLPENALGDIGNWHLFGDDEESQEKRHEMYCRTQEMHIRFEQFDTALAQYKSGLERLDLDCRRLLFAFLSGGERSLTYENFKQVKLIPSYCLWSNTWVNSKSEHWNDDDCRSGSPRQSGRARPVAVLLGSFRSFTDEGAKAWFALHVAVGNYEKIATGQGLQRSRPTPAPYDADSGHDSDDWSSESSASSVALAPAGSSFAFMASARSAKLPARLDADWGFSTDPEAEGSRAPTLQDFILQRFDPSLGEHARMRVGDLLAPCGRLEGYVRGDGGWARAEAKKVAIGTAHEVYDPVRYCWFLKSPGQESDVRRVPWWWSYFFSMEDEPGRFWLTFKPELYMPVLYSHLRLWLMTVRLFALTGVNVLTIRHSYGSRLLSVLRCRPSVWLSLAPCACSALLLIYMLPFAPVLIAFVGVWALVLRPLERHSHCCCALFRVPMFTTAPALAMALMFFPCRLLTSWRLPDTYLCNYSKIVILHSAALSSITKIRSSLGADFSVIGSGLLLLFCAAVVIVPLNHLLSKNKTIQWLLMRMAYRAWLNRSENLLALLHEGELEKTAQRLSAAFFDSLEQHGLRQTPGCAWLLCQCNSDAATASPSSLSGIGQSDPDRPSGDPDVSDSDFGLVSMRTEESFSEWAGRAAGAVSSAPKRFGKSLQNLTTSHSHAAS